MKAAVLQLLGVSYVASTVFGTEPSPEPAAEEGLRILQAQCTRCHGGVRTKGGVHFHELDSLLRPKASGAVPLVPSDPEASEIWRRIASEDPDERMPPDGRLSASDQESIYHWIASGAPMAGTWSTRPLTEREPRSAESALWARNALDVAALRLWEPFDLQPSDAADPDVLIRRVSLDLTGLPPDPDVAKSFVRDPTDDRYQAIVDSLLESEAFGERWGRHWLDQARYADSDGYEKDRPRPHAWRFRDWVIESINADLPMDVFARYQIAGDLLNDPTAWAATGFHRQTLHNTEGGVDPEEDRVKRTMDRANTVASIWLARTFECAQCHNHPYDGIRQEDYYRFYSYFNNLEEPEPALWRDPEDAQAFEEKNRAYGLVREEGGDRLRAWIEELRQTPDRPGDADLPDSVKAWLEQGNAADVPDAVANHYFESVDPASRAAYSELSGWRAARQTPAMVVSERSANRRETYLFVRGDFLNPDTELGPMEASPPLGLFAPSPSGQAGDRNDLVDWMFGPASPLVARALANNVWSHLFGAGIAEPVDDFGVRTQEPEARLLLDVAASILMDSGWSRKELIRAIVLSSVYRQSTTPAEGTAVIDPDNRLFAAQKRFRLEAEILRDVFLDAAGLLDRSIGGPSVFPPLDPDVAKQSYADNFAWKTSGGGDRYRRGLYTFFKRTAPHPDLTVFDCPDSTRTVSRRGLSNSALQALTLMRSEAFHEAASALGARLASGTQEDRSKIEEGFWLLLARPSNEQEEKVLLDFIDDLRQALPQQPGIGMESGSLGPKLAREQAVWTLVARALLNMDATLTRP